MDPSIITDIRKAEQESADILKQAEADRAKILQQAQEDISKQTLSREKARKEKEETAFSQAAKGIEAKEKAILERAEKESLLVKEKAGKSMPKAMAYIEKEFMSSVK